MLHVHDAGLLAYRPAWDLQLQFHERVLADSLAPEPGELADGALIFVEHPPVVTIGRRPGAEKHVLLPAKLLAAKGVEVVETDRGGDVTFHGPGQLVAYPIIPLNRYKLNLHTYMRLMEEAVIQTLAHFGIEALRDPSPSPATGVWAPTKPGETPPATLAKICAMGIKVRRWVTLHGLALNVTTDLSCFQLINPCGLSRPVTSMRELLGQKCPQMDVVKTAMIGRFARLL